MLGFLAIQSALKAIEITKKENKEKAEKSKVAPAAPIEVAPTQQEEIELPQV